MVAGLRPRYGRRWNRRVPHPRDERVVGSWYGVAPVPRVILQDFAQNVALFQFKSRTCLHHAPGAFQQLLTIEVKNVGMMSLMNDSV
jgi:hypothetical protein